MFYNKSHGGGGSLYNRVRKLRNGTKAGANNASIIEFEANANEEENLEEEVECDPAESLLWLKKAVVNTDNMTAILKHLKQTSEYRKEMMKDKTLDLLEQFPFMFTNPILVIYFY